MTSVRAYAQTGPEFLEDMPMVAWMKEKEYDSIDQMRGSMNIERSPNPREYARVNYIHISFRQGICERWFELPACLPAELLEFGLFSSPPPPMGLDPPASSGLSSITFNNLPGDFGAPERPGHPRL